MTSPRFKVGIQDTIIVGAGIAGEACARRLDHAQRQFLAVSETVGGRIQPSRDGTVNLGAYYVRADYRHVNQLVERGRRINTLRTLRHDREGSYTFWNRRLYSHLPQAARFLRQLRKFAHHYQRLKDLCVVESQARAIRSDPYLWGLYRQPAADFVEQHHLGAVARYYLGPGLHGTTFLPLSHLTAFVLLLGALPVLVPIYEFTRISPEDADWTRAVLNDSVTGIIQDRHLFRVDTEKNGTLFARQVVVATPPHVAKRLLGLPEVKAPVRVHSFVIAGRLREPWAGADINLFSEDNPVCAIAQQSNGSTLFCSQQERPDLGHYFTSWEIVEHKDWNPAFNLLGDTLLECEQAPGLYLVGDHNICGLEDAYLTGLYAANQITQRGAGPAHVGTYAPATSALERAVDP